MKKEGVTRRRFLEKTAKTAAVVAASSTVPGLITGCKKSEAEFDIIIKGGTVYDGSLAEPKIVDIGIKGDKITAIGKIEGNAARTIDATGLIVTPGFIDVHTHCDLTFKRLGMKRLLAYVFPSFKGNYNYLYQGVTTVVTGNCGYGYTDLNEWFDIHESVGFGSNVYHHIPHGALRLELFGEKQPEKLSAEQLETFKRKVAEEMEKGAMGFSTRLDVPPGSMTATEELIEIGKVVQKYGGLYATHMRDESGTIYDDGSYGVLKSIEEAIEIGRKANLPVEISHLKINSPINNLKASRLLALIENARKEGLDVTADQYPYDSGSTDITAIIPQKYVDSAGVIKNYRDGAGRKELKQAIDVSFKDLGPEKTLVVWYPGKEELEGKTLKEVAEMTGKDAAECLIDMGSEEKLPVGVFFSQDMNVVRNLMPHDYIFTISDGWTIPKDMMKPHPRLYGTFPKKLRQFVLEEKLLTLKAALRSMTSLPAAKFKMKGRGTIAEGNFADITVINLKTIADKATYTDPHQYAEGVEYVLVNGVIGIDGGKATGDRGGRPVRRT
jgi:N-acyl-D-amino-acid deacylase